MKLKLQTYWCIRLWAQFVRGITTSQNKPYKSKLQSFLSCESSTSEAKFSCKTENQNRNNWITLQFYKASCFFSYFQYQGYQKNLFKDHFDFWGFNVLNKKYQNNVHLSFPIIFGNFCKVPKSAASPMSISLSTENKQNLRDKNNNYRWKNFIKSKETSWHHTGTIVIMNNKPWYRYAEIYSTQLLQSMPRLHRQKLKLFKNSHPNINMHILHIVLHTFPQVLARRICLTIKNFFY